jgi:hypothetical protein
MFFYDLPLFWIQWARLEEHGIGHANFPHVVQGGGGKDQPGSASKRSVTSCPQVEKCLLSWQKEH